MKKLKKYKIYKSFKKKNVKNNSVCNCNFVKKTVKTIIY